MKGLVITLGIVIMLVGVGFGTSAFLHHDLSESIDAALAKGQKDGFEQGYAQGLKDGTEAGYQEGSMVGYVSGLEFKGESDTPGNYFLFNPTYEELQKFLEFEGINTAKELHDFSEVNGLRVAYVRCPIARPASEGRVYLYQLVAFETVDEGIIIIEPGTNREVKVEVGESYSELNGFPPKDYDDTITKVTFVW